MTERLDELLASMCTGDLTPAEQRELDAVFASDPEALTTAVAHWRLHRQLPLALRGDTGDWFPATVDKALKRPSAVLRRPRSVRRSRRVRPTAAWILPLAAAALLLVALSLGLLGRSPTAVNNPLPPGIVVTGQGRLEARGEAWYLPSGRVEIEADHRATSLVFSTPHAEFEIVGTRFSLDVGVASTSLEVSEGRVRMSVGNEVREVAAGERLRSDTLMVEASRPAALPTGGRVWTMPWPSQPDPGWKGHFQVGGGLRTQPNDEKPQDALAMTPFWKDGPVIPRGGRWSVSYRSTATATRPGALWMLVTPAGGGDNITCKADLALRPGATTTTCELSDFRNTKTNGAVSLVGAQVIALALLGWGGAPDDLYWTGCELIGTDSR
jgi:hypothetical protein